MKTILKILRCIVTTIVVILALPAIIYFFILVGVYMLVDDLVE
jgi:hypothetical protein